MRSSPGAAPIRLLAALGGLILFTAACSSSGAASSSPGARPSTAPAATTVAASATAAASVATASQGAVEAYVVSIANGAVGAYLTGEAGKTLYTFKADSANTSACTDACATKWPPFIIAAGDTLKPDAGVTGALTTFARPDGTLQVAVAGAPLYYYAGDSTAGDTTGQGIGGKWFVASPSGTAPDSATPSAKASGRYGY